MNYDFAIELEEPVRDVYLLNPESEKLLQFQVEREREIYMRGRVEGERALSEQLIQQRMQMRELQNGVFESLNRAIPSIAAQCEKMLIELAVEVARKLVCDLPVDANMVAASIREALKQVGDTTEFTIYLNPSDLELLKQMNCAPDITERKGIKLVASTDVSKGGCIVNTRFGTIDNRRETKLRIIKDSIIES
ncbi:MAG: FliH/SctL family protein [Verrucomicrobiia bacterium]